MQQFLDSDTQSINEIILAPTDKLRHGRDVVI